eukprot:Awhi_evm2s3618
MLNKTKKNNKKKQNNLNYLDIFGDQDPERMQVFTADNGDENDNNDNEIRNESNIINILYNVSNNSNIDNIDDNNDVDIYTYNKKNDNNEVSKIKKRRYTVCSSTSRPPFQHVQPININGDKDLSNDVPRRNSIIHSSTTPPLSPHVNDNVKSEIFNQRNNVTSTQPMSHKSFTKNNSKSDSSYSVTHRSPKLVSPHQCSTNNNPKSDNFRRRNSVAHSQPLSTNPQSFTNNSTKSDSFNRRNSVTHSSASITMPRRRPSDVIPNSPPPNVEAKQSFDFDLKRNPNQNAYVYGQTQNENNSIKKRDVLSPDYKHKHKLKHNRNHNHHDGKDDNVQYEGVPVQKRHSTNDISSVHNQISQISLNLDIGPRSTSRGKISNIFLSNPKQLQVTTNCKLKPNQIDNCIHQDTQAPGNPNPSQNNQFKGRIPVKCRRGSLQNLPLNSISSTSTKVSAQIDQYLNNNLQEGTKQHSSHIDSKLQFDSESSMNLDQNINFCSLESSSRRKSIQLDWSSTFNESNNGNFQSEPITQRSSGDNLKAQGQYINNTVPYETGMSSNRSNLVPSSRRESFSHDHLRVPRRHSDNLIYSSTTLSPIRSDPGLPFGDYMHIKASRRHSDNLVSSNVSLSPDRSIGNYTQLNNFVYPNTNLSSNGSDKLTCSNTSLCPNQSDSTSSLGEESSPENYKRVPGQHSDNILCSNEALSEEQRLRQHVYIPPIIEKERSLKNSLRTPGQNSNTNLSSNRTGNLQCQPTNNGFGKNYSSTAKSVGSYETRPGHYPENAVMTLLEQDMLQQHESNYRSQGFRSNFDQTVTTNQNTKISTVNKFNRYNGGENTHISMLNSSKTRTSGCKLAKVQTT